MAKWDINPSDGVTNNNNGTFIFPANTADTEIKYTIKYTSDTNCTASTTISMPKKCEDDNYVPPIQFTPRTFTIVVNNAPGRFIQFVKMDGEFVWRNPDGGYEELEWWSGDSLNRPSKIPAPVFTFSFNGHAYIDVGCPNPSEMIASASLKLNTETDISKLGCRRKNGQWISSLDDVYLLVYVGGSTLFYFIGSAISCNEPASVRDASGVNFEKINQGYNTLLSKKGYGNLGSTTFFIEPA